jgi:hypothetical protein
MCLEGQLSTQRKSLRVSGVLIESWPAPRECKSEVLPRTFLGFGDRTSAGETFFFTLWRRSIVGRTLPSVRWVPAVKRPGVTLVIYLHIVPRLRVKHSLSWRVHGNLYFSYHLCARFVSHVYCSDACFHIVKTVKTWPWKVCWIYTSVSLY